MPIRDPIKKREYDIAYRKKNIERKRELDRNWKRNNPEKRKAAAKRDREKYPERIQKYKIKYKESGKTLEWQRKSRYGISKDDYEKLLINQNHVCPICKGDFIHKKKYIDHDHKTGIVRGIIHFKCNLLLGNAQDNTSILENAINYLKDLK